MSGPQTSRARRMLAFKLSFSNYLSICRHFDGCPLMMQVKKKMMVVMVGVGVVTKTVMMVLTALVIMVMVVTVL